MKRSRKIGIICLAVLLLYSTVEFALFAAGHVGTFNAVRRSLAGAPQIELYGQTLAYADVEKLESSELVPLNRTEESLPNQVYKLAAAPDNPPYVFVLKGNDAYFKYRVPKAAWRM
ncbi:hypothetical protein B9G55_18215 [Saccharibacillus sp. O16]|nr:hypothetical protein B9G55_18215 [Saccharibacillus sp. O16]